MMKTVFVDTNFWVSCTRYKIDLLSELRRVLSIRYKVCVLDKTLQELEKIKTGKGASARHAAFSLRMMKPMCIVRTRSKKTVDDILVDKAGPDVVVATQDRELKKRVKEKGSSVVVIRQKKYLVLIPS